MNFHSSQPVGLAIFFIHIPTFEYISSTLFGCCSERDNYWDSPWKGLSTFPLWISWQQHYTRLQFSKILIIAVLIFEMWWWLRWIIFQSSCLQFSPNFSFVKTWTMTLGLVNYGLSVKMKNWAFWKFILSEHIKWVKMNLEIHYLVLPSSVPAPVSIGLIWLLIWFTPRTHPPMEKCNKSISRCNPSLLFKVFFKELSPLETPLLI